MTADGYHKSGPKIKVQRHDSPAADFYMAKQPWVEEAACLGMSPTLFFEDVEGTRGASRVDSIAKARAICAACPVLQECAEQAMVEENDAAEGHRFGFRGGMTSDQRVSVQRRGGLNGRDPMMLVDGWDGKRKVPPVPLDGDKWSRHHTTLARKVVRWVVDNVEVGAKLPSQTELRAALGCKTDPLRRVLLALVQDGTLDFSGRVGRGSNKDNQRYVRRGAPRVIASWLPTHLR